MDFYTERFAADGNTNKMASESWLIHLWIWGLRLMSLPFPQLQKHIERSAIADLSTKVWVCSERSASMAFPKFIRKKPHRIIFLKWIRLFRMMRSSRGDAFPKIAFCNRAAVFWLWTLASVLGLRDDWVIGGRWHLSRTAEGEERPLWSAVLCPL